MPSARFSSATTWLNVNAPPQPTLKTPPAFASNALRFAWTTSSTLATSFALAVAVGTALAYYTNKDSLHGTLRTVTLRPRGGVPALEAELYDGSGILTLVWLGRRRIAGIEPGRNLRVEGRIGRMDGARVMFNPRYELKCP